MMEEKLVKDIGLNGLTQEQVEKNIKDYGKNKIKEKKKNSALSILLSNSMT